MIKPPLDRNGEPLADGLYRVEFPPLMNAFSNPDCILAAGFVIEGGVVTRCAPYLRRRLADWALAAERVNILDCCDSSLVQSGQCDTLQIAEKSAEQKNT